MRRTSWLLLIVLAGCSDSADGTGGASIVGGRGEGAAAASVGGAPGVGGAVASGGAATGGDAGEGGGGYPASEVDCHPREVSSAHGAYFRKVSSGASAELQTIHAVGVLPRVVIDTARWFSTQDPALFHQNGPLDRPSLYLGGRGGGTEVDAGLTWDRVYHTDGRPTWTDDLESGSDGGDLSRRFVETANGDVESVLGAHRPEGLTGLIEDFAFRPYWRAAGVWANPPVGSAQNVYFYPEQGFRMQVRTAGPDQLELTINDDEGLGKHFSTTFAAPGWNRGGAQSFKRVHAIDQFTVIDGARIGLESADLDVLPTATRVEMARWTEVRVLGAQGAELTWLDCDAPAVVGSDALFETSYDEIFLLWEQTPLGGETSVIAPFSP